ncbi:MAG: hypothetical protein LC101_03360 [Flavobacteriales bacterium]|nr:hypothetical protein [Flavobacteriales bacterium]
MDLIITSTHVLIILCIAALFLKRHTSVFGYALIVLLCIELFFSLILDYTAKHGYHNHYLANLQVLIVFPVLLYLIYRLHRTYYLDKTAFPATLFLFLLLHIAGWLLENILFSDIYTYNNYIASADAALIFLITLYMLQGLIFSFFVTPYRLSLILILSALCINYSFSFIFLIFLNFDFSFSNEFYSKLLLIISSVYLISYSLFLLSILWLPKKMKYSSLY